jgi:hypothetical protein
VAQLVLVVLLAVALVVLAQVAVVLVQQIKEMLVVVMARLHRVVVAAGQVRLVLMLLRGSLVMAALVVRIL